MFLVSFLLVLYLPASFFSYISTFVCSPLSVIFSLSLSFACLSQGSHFSQGLHTHSISLFLVCAWEPFKISSKVYSLCLVWHIPSIPQCGNIKALMAYSVCMCVYIYIYMHLYIHTSLFIDLLLEERKEREISLFTVIDLSILFHVCVHVQAHSPGDGFLA